jgi:cytochrome c556
MNRKWVCLALAPALLVAFSVLAGLSIAQDTEKEKDHDKETPLGKVMAEVQKKKIAITKATRNVAAYKKGQKDVEKAATELAKLAKEAKPFKDAVKNAKNEPNAEKKWDEFMDAFADHSKKLAEAAAKSETTQKAAKDIFQTVNKACTDCHTVFRIDESGF